MTKIKLKYPTRIYNRLGNPAGGYMISDAISQLIHTQERKNDPKDNLDLVRDDVKNPGTWTLHFDGKDFYLEGSEDLITYTQLEKEIK